MKKTNEVSIKAPFVPMLTSVVHVKQDFFFFFFLKLSEFFFLSIEVSRLKTKEHVFTMEYFISVYFLTSLLPSLYIYINVIASASPSFLSLYLLSQSHKGNLKNK